MLGSFRACSAVELGKDDASVLWMAAYAAWRLADDAERARELAYSSLRLNPNSAIALAIAGWTENRIGDPGKALELFHSAERLSPRDPRGWLIETGLGAAYFNCGRFEEAVRWCETAVRHNPRSTVALRSLATSLAKAGQREKAAAVIHELLNIEPQLTLTSLRARLRWLDETPRGRTLLEALRLAGLPE